MIINKKTKATANASSYAEGVLKPLNESDYPDMIINDGKRYDRIWVRPRVIVYTIQYELSRAHLGYYVVPFKKVFADYFKMEAFVEMHEHNKSLLIIAK